MPLRPPGLDVPALDLELIAQGKVRSIYAIPGHDDKLGQYVDDCLSVFDVVLGFPIPGKGRVLNGLNLHVKLMLEEAGIVKTDLVAWGAGVDDYLPERLRGNAETQSRLTIVRKLEPVMVECVIRDYLWGSAVKDYDPETGMLHGQFVGKGLKKGDKFECPIFDPTTKAAHGQHDEPISAEEVERLYPGLKQKALEVFIFLSEWARERGFIFVDTKFEFALVNGEWVLVDEVATLDSSRFWTIEDRQKFEDGKLKDIPELSKQYARDEAIKIGIQALAEAEKWDEAQAVLFSRSQITCVEMIYRYMFWQLTDDKLEEFWQKFNVSFTREDVILVVTGSKSDESQLADGLEVLARSTKSRYIICSCHRSKAQLMVILSRACKGTYGPIKAIIACAGMAAALPGDIKAILAMFGYGEIPVLGVAMESSNADSIEKGYDEDAALASIERLPGKPVELADEENAYFGPEGFTEACQDAIEHEFLPRPMKELDAVFDDGTTITKREAFAELAEVFAELAADAA